MSANTIEAFHAYWLELKGGRHIPVRTDIDPARGANGWLTWCAMVESVDRSVRVVSTNAAQFIGENQAIRRLSEAPGVGGAAYRIGLALDMALTGRTTRLAVDWFVGTPYAHAGALGFFPFSTSYGCGRGDRTMVVVDGRPGMPPGLGPRWDVGAIEFIDGEAANVVPLGVRPALRVVAGEYSGQIRRHGPLPAWGIINGGKA